MRAFLGYKKVYRVLGSVLGFPNFRKLAYCLNYQKRQPNSMPDVGAPDWVRQEEHQLPGRC